MKVVLDTNFLYAFFVENDVHNEDAMQVFSSFPNFIELVIPSIVVAELLASGENIDFIAECLELTSKFEDIQLVDLEFMKTIAPKTRSSLKANDCLLIAIAARLDAKIITFDKKIIRNI
jgi:predicted nucleic acid-binding protein